MTTPVRTIADLRRAASVDDVRRAVREAEFKRLDLGSRADEDLDLTRSELERRFLGLCTRRAIPKPEVNVKIGSFEVDFLWRAQRLVVETDGWEAHGTPSSFEADRARDGELKLMGYEVVRFTYRQVTREPRRVAAIVRALLEA